MTSTDTVTNTATLHAPRVEMRVVMTTRAINAIWSNIATQHAKRNVDHSTRKHALELLNCMTNLFEFHLAKSIQTSIRLVKSVQSA